MDDKSREYLQEIGAIIRSKRKECDLSQEQFAFEVGLDRTYISDIECGKRNFSMINLRKICQALGVTESELFSQLTIKV